MSSTNPLEDFRAAMRQSGCDYPGEIKPDGTRHRVNFNGEKGVSGWYRLWQNGDFYNGCFGDWKTGVNDKWNSYNGSNMTREERQELARQIAQAQQETRTEEQKIRSEAKSRALRILSAASPCESHLYLIQKSVDAHGEIRVCTADFKLSEDFTLPVKNCLVLPLRTIDGVLQTVEFISSDKRFGRDGEKRNKQLLYGGDPKGAFYTVSIRDDGPLVLCEGYATGATIFEATGYAVVCSRNAGNLLPVATALRKKYPARDIIICSDNDRFVTKQGEPYNPGVDYATKAAAAIKAALATPQFADSDLESSDFNDLAEVTGDNGRRAVFDTITAAYKDFKTPKFESLPAVKNANDLAAAEIVLPTELVKGVMHRGMKTVLASNSKARKTWTQLDLAISVNAGVPWWGWETVKGKVLYINFEIAEGFFRQRMLQVATAKGVSDLSNLDVWTLRGYGTALFNLMPDLIAQILYGEYVLVIIDPIYKTLGGRDENDAGDIGEVCNELERIAVQTKAAVFYAGHYSKGNQAGKDPLDRMSGSGVWSRDADTIITLTSHVEEGAYTVDLILRNFPETESFVVKWQFPLMQRATELSPDDLKKPGGRPSEYSMDDFVGLLAEQSLTVKDWRKAADTQMGMPKATFFRFRDQALKANRVIYSRVTDRWTLVLQQPAAPPAETPLQRALREARQEETPQNPPDVDQELPL